MSNQPEQHPQEQPQQDTSQVPAEPAGVPTQPPDSPSAEAARPVQGAGSPEQPSARPKRRILIGSQRDPAAYRVRPRRDWIPVRKGGSQPGGKPPEPPAESGGRSGTPAAGAEAAPTASSPSAAAEPPVAPASAVQPVASATPTPVEAAAEPPTARLEVSRVGSANQAGEPLPLGGEKTGLQPSAPGPEVALPGSAPTPAPAPGDVVGADVRATGPTPWASAAPSGNAFVASSAVEEVPAVEGTPLPPAAVQRPSAEPARVERGIAGAEAPVQLPEPEEKKPAGRGRRDRRDRSRAERASELGPVITRTVEPPSVRQKLSPDLEEEFAQAMADVPLEEMIAATTSATRAALEPDSRHAATVIDVRRDDVFVELGSREQGILPLKSFAEPPQAGQTIEVIVLRFNSDDGLYELALPGAAAEVGDWSSLSEGMLVEARITGYNAGGLECEVNRIRGFIPVSQIALYRVENLAEFVEQKLTCLVVEANPQRRRLVLSRRAVLEREKAEARQRLLDSLAPGQVLDGVVRKLMDFGAFVDLGGVDGLLHISQLSWGRVKHPREVLEEGQRIRVRIDKIDRDTGKISLGYKDLLEDPWTAADRKYLPNTRTHGRVVKIMDFGAFVELERGVEGLIHISELSHKRVARVSDVLKEGEEVDVMVLGVDMQARRISLSLKNLTPPSESEAGQAPPSAAQEPAEPPPAPKPKKPTIPLRGGLGRSPGGSLFGLKW